MVIAAILLALAAVVIAWMLAPRSSASETVQEILHPGSTGVDKK